MNLDQVVTMLVGAFYARYLAASEAPDGFARGLVEIVWNGIGNR